MAGGFVKSGPLCDQAAHDLYMQQKCQALANGEIDIQLGTTKITTVKTLADANFIPRTYYEDLNACKEGGYLPRDSKGMILP